MSKYIPYIVVLIIGAVICFLLMKGCRPGSSIDRIEDSLRIEKALNDSIKISAVIVKKSNDSILTVKTKGDSAYKHKIDSQAHIIAILKGQFKVTKDSIGTLYDQLKTFYLAHDTTDLYKTYSELRDQLTTANNELFAIQIARDSSDYIRNNEITRLNGIITTLQGQIKEYQSLLVQCTDNSAALAKNGQLAAKKAKAIKLWQGISAGLAAVIAILLIAK